MCQGVFIWQVLGRHSPQQGPTARDQLFLASPLSAQLAVTSSLRSACPQHSCPHLFARDLKLLEIFKMSKTNSHRKKKELGRANYWHTCWQILYFLQKEKYADSSLVTHRKCCWEHARNTYLLIRYSRIMTSGTSARDAEHCCVFSPVGGIALQ